MHLDQLLHFAHSWSIFQSFFQGSFFKGSFFLGSFFQGSLLQGSCLFESCQPECEDDELLEVFKLLDEDARQELSFDDSDCLIEVLGWLLRVKEQNFEVK